MLNNKHLTLIFCVALITIVAFQAQPVEAITFDDEFTNIDIGAGDSYEVYGVMNIDDEITGYFETHLDTQGLKFFICDVTNWLIWDSGSSATVYELETNMHTMGFSFIIPYSDTWYMVFSNDEGSTPVTVDIGVDINDDNIPYYDPSSYTETGYGIVLEDDEYYIVYDTFAAGTDIDGHFSTFFSTDGLDFFICDQENFNQWDAGSSATGFSIETDMHQSSIDEFTIPTAGVWYCVFVATDEVDTVTFSFGIDVDTSGAITTPTSNGELQISPVMLGVIAAVFLVIILVCVVSRRKRGDTGPAPTVDHYTAP
ncbi:MAG: hypothetical protein ACTSWA_05805, partial [Candidatus Thorarchaeota archaeon]